jgi:hypothetical protein
MLAVRMTVQFVAPTLLQCRSKKCRGACRWRSGQPSASKTAQSMQQDATEDREMLFPPDGIEDRTQLG